MRSEVYAYLHPSAVVALVPAALPAGSYKLVLRTASKGGKIFEGVWDMAISAIAAAEGPA